MSNTEIVRLNVGGTKYVTTKSTLWKYPQSVLGAMFMGNAPLPTDQDGYYFIDRCGPIFQYILQFLRCGKLVLPKYFSELDLLQTEADFYQIEDLILAVEHHKREVNEERDEVRVMLLCTVDYTNEYRQKCRDMKICTKLKDAGFKLVSSHVYDFSKAESKIKSYLQSNCWVLKEHKTLQSYEALAFFCTLAVETDKIFECSRQYNTVDVETWIREPSADLRSIK